MKPLIIAVFLIAFTCRADDEIKLPQDATYMEALVKSHAAAKKEFPEAYRAGTSLYGQFTADIRETYKNDPAVFQNPNWPLLIAAGSNEKEKEQAAYDKAVALLGERKKVRMALINRLDEILDAEQPNGNPFFPYGVSQMDVGTRSELLDLISNCKQEDGYFIDALPVVEKQMTEADEAQFRDAIRRDNHAFTEAMDDKFRKIQMYEDDRNQRIAADNAEKDKVTQERIEMQQRPPEVEDNSAMFRAKINELQSDQDQLQQQQWMDSH